LVWFYCLDLLLQHKAASGERAVTPVIATIILIAGTLVLALVVGAYTFGLFGSNVKTVTLSSATLYGGTEPAALAPAASGATYMTFSLNNPGSASTVTSVTLTGAGITAVTQWGNNGGTDYLLSGNNALSAGQVSSYTFYPYGTSQTITTGQTFNYVISFANGQSVSGSVIAQ
jgi:flagellin-like protein